MSGILDILAQLRSAATAVGSAIWAIDVRDDIASALRKSADAIEECYRNVNSASLREDAFAAALQDAIDDELLPIPATVIEDNSLPGSKIQQGSLPLDRLAEPVQITVDSALSDSSTNPVQNKVVKGALDELNGSLGEVSKKIIAIEEEGEVKLPILFLYGDESEIETNWQNRSKNKMNFRYTFYNPNKKKQKCGWCKLSLQGNSTLNFVKHNYNIQFYKDAGYKTKDKVDYMDLTGDKHPKWTLKSNQNDYSQARNVVSARLWGDIVHCRKGMSDALSNAPNHGAINGHPVLLYMNDAYYGLYMFNMSKSDWMIGINEDEPLHCAVSSGGVTPSTQWTANSFSGWELEIPDEWQVVPSEEGEAENVTARERFLTLQNFVINSSDEDFYAHLNDRLDVLSAIDYLIYSFCICNVDSMNKNQFLVTWDGGKKWVFTAYDMDQTFGGNYGTSTPSPYDRDLFNTHPNFLFRRLINNFGQEILDRYAVLRSGALSYGYMARELEIFFSEFPKGAKELDLAKWRVNQFVSISDLESMKRFVNKRLLWCDTYFAKMNPDRIACNNLELNTHALTCSIPHDETTILATPNPINTTDPIVWMSSDDSIATVNQNGGIIPIADGTVTITAKCGDYSDTCTVTVNLMTRGDIDYTENALDGVTWNNGKIYDDTGTMVDSGTNDKCTDKFSLQNCLYKISGGSSVNIHVWNENGEYVGRLSAPNDVVNGIEGYQYAIKAYTVPTEFKPINNYATQQEFKRFVITGISGKSNRFYYINNQYKLQEISSYIHVDNGALSYTGVDFVTTNVSGCVTFGTGANSKAVGGFIITFTVSNGNIECWIYPSAAILSQYDTVAKMNEYLAEHPITLYFNID